MGQTDRLCFERFELFQTLICFQMSIRVTFVSPRLWKDKSTACYILLFVDMTGIIPEEEDEEQEMYDDVGAVTNSAAEPQPIDEDIYEELPGPNTHFTTAQQSLMPLIPCFWVRNTLIWYLVSTEEDIPTPQAKPPPKVEPSSKPAPPPAAAGTQLWALSLVSTVCIYFSMMIREAFTINADQHMSHCLCVAVTKPSVTNRRS